MEADDIFSDKIWFFGHFFTIGITVLRDAGTEIQARLQPGRSGLFWHPWHSSMLLAVWPWLLKLDHPVLCINSGEVKRYQVDPSQLLSLVVTEWHFAFSHFFFSLYYSFQFLDPRKGPRIHASMLSQPINLNNYSFDRGDGRSENLRGASNNTRKIFRWIRFCP